MSLFSSGQTAVRLSGAEAADRAQCAAPDKPIGYWNLLVVFANLKRVIQCACFKSLGSRKGTSKCNLCILAVAQHLPRKWRLVSTHMPIPAICVAGCNICLQSKNAVVFAFSCSWHSFDLTVCKHNTNDLIDLNRSEWVSEWFLNGTSVK